MRVAYEYLVIDIMDERGRVNVASLQERLNGYGRDGWHLVSAYSNELGKNALSLAGIGINSTADQNILILEREYEAETKEEREERERERKREEEGSRTMLAENAARKEAAARDMRDRENERLVRQYADAQLGKDSMREILELQEAYFNTTSLAFIKNIVPDATCFGDVAAYKSALNDALKEMPSR
ncbi:MAG: hypothetical protein K2H73_06920 [Treponemataceae bacterium]|nr:hypothetical protein [Treponemataceae bacterium]